MRWLPMITISCVVLSTTFALPSGGSALYVLATGSNPHNNDLDAQTEYLLKRFLDDSINAPAFYYEEGEEKGQKASSTFTANFLSGEMETERQAKEFSAELDQMMRLDDDPYRLFYTNDGAPTEQNMIQEGATPDPFSTEGRQHDVYCSVRGNNTPRPELSKQASALLGTFKRQRDEDEDDMMANADDSDESDEDAEEDSEDDDDDDDDDDIRVYESDPEDLDDEVPEESDDETDTDESDDGDIYLDSGDEEDLLPTVQTLPALPALPRSVRLNAVPKQDKKYLTVPPKQSSRSERREYAKKINRQSKRKSEDVSKGEPSAGKRRRLSNV